MRKGLMFAVVVSAFLGLVPLANAAPDSSAKHSSSSVAAVSAPRLNLNSANAESLQRDLFGIGAAKAKAIIAYRETNGPFTAIDELLEVKGIGKALLEKNRDRLEVN